MKRDVSSQAPMALNGRLPNKNIFLTFMSVLLFAHCSKSGIRSVSSFGFSPILKTYSSRAAAEAQSSTFLRRTSYRMMSSRSIDQNGNAETSTTTTTTMTASVPPTARREEDRYILAGKLAETEPNYLAPDGKPLARQSDSSPNALLDPPVKVSDPYGWLRDESRTVPEVLEHLNNENAYTEHLTAHLSDLRSDIYQEMLAGIKETDYTVPVQNGEWLYYSRTFEGKSYKSMCRAPLKDGWEELAKQWDGSMDSPILPGEVAYLDVNELAEGKSYCATGQVRPSPSHNVLAYSADFTGNEVCQIFVKDINTGEIIDHDETLECYGQLQWGADDKTIFYLKMDSEKRPYQLYRHVIGSDEPDELLYQEDNALYWVGLSKSFDDKYIFVSSRSKESAEVHFLDLTDSNAKLQCVAERRKKVLYSVRHRAGSWFITTNVGGTPNMRLMVSPAVANSEDSWKDMVDQNGNVMFNGGYERAISGFTSFESHSVASGREGGLPQIWVVSYASETTSDVTDFVQLSFEEDAYDVGLGGNSMYNADHVVIAYDSLVTPLSSIKIPLDSPTDLSKRTVLKEQEVPGYNRSDYSCERTTVKSRDGSADIPVSIVYRKDVEEKIKSGEAVPAHLYGYGSYGACMEASFRSTRRALLDRGMVYVIAHVRGGGEMGRQWYEEPNGAKYLCKQNTFNDFVDVAKWMIDDRKITTPNQLSCEGRSAGGLLIGASINQAPELFKMALLGVPFVDVVCTMIDATIPLTVVEWEEWGNPNEEKFHKCMMEYSPINNVKDGATYPSCLLTGGLHDPRVQYWEPAKFAAELRHKQGSSSGPVAVKIDMAAGHFSASDRYKYLKELAFDYAFLLDQLGLVDAKKA
uniref:Prolyl endopeptidase n=1 Tax=Ditylum brightwellii TaxID=49249 RepID=A0A7S4QT86_9STRA